MPPTPTVSMAVDVQARRLQTDRLVQLVDGTQWDTYASTANGWIDPITSTAMLRPAPLSPDWYTSVSGNYVRRAKSEYSIAGSADWIEYSRVLNGDYYIHGLGVNTKVYLNEALPKNRPMWLSWFAYNTGGEAFPQMECGWGEGTIAEIGLQFWSDGNVKVFKNGLQVGSGSITETNYYPSFLAGQDGETGKTKNVTANEVVEVCLIPYRHAELLVFSASTGGGFNHKFLDIADDEVSPIITGAGQFWCQVLTGQATMQAVPLKFSEDTTLLSQAFDFRAAPNSGATPSGSTYFNLAGYGVQSTELYLKQADGIANFVADGVERRARIRVDMLGDGNSTPFVYGAGVAFDAATGLTPIDSATNLDDYWMVAEWEVPDDPTGVRLRVDLKNPVAIEAAGAYALRRIGNRPFQADLGDYPIFYGRSMEPDGEVAPTDESEVLTLDCRDEWVRFEKTLISDPEPFDGMYLHDAIARLCHIAGLVPAEYFIETIDWTLPLVGLPSKGEWALLPEVGDTVAQWIQRLHEEFARKFVYGFIPTTVGVVFYFVSPEFLTDTPNAYLYLSNDDQPVPGGETTAQRLNRYRLWANTFRERVAPPEANDIYVVGRDPRFNLPLVGHWRDYDSVDATVPVNARADNWLGELRQYAWVDPSLTTYAAVNFVMAVLIDTVTPVRKYAEWESQLLLTVEGLPIWRGDVVQVIGKGLYRVVSFSGTFDLEKADAGSDTAKDRIDRRFRYTAEYIGAEP